MDIKGRQAGSPSLSASGQLRAANGVASEAHIACGVGLSEQERAVRGRLVTAHEHTRVARSSRNVI